MDSRDARSPTEYDCLVTAQIIDGKAVAEQVRSEVAERAGRLKSERGITPGLALVLVGDNPSSLSYVRSKGDTAEQAGLYSDFFHFPESTDAERVISHIQDLDADSRFHGILVQLPLPKHMNENAVISAIEPAKDADGVTATSLGRLLRGEPTCCSHSGASYHSDPTVRPCWRPATPCRSRMPTGMSSGGSRSGSRSKNTRAGYSCAPRSVRPHECWLRLAPCVRTSSPDYRSWARRWTWR